MTTGNDIEATEADYNDGVLLVDEGFVADSLADTELGSDDAEQIDDIWLRGCRLQVIRRIAEPISLAHGAGGVVRFACIFQAGSDPRLRFSSAQISMRIETPAEAKIVELQPQSITDEHPTEFTLETTGKLGLKAVQKLPGIEAGVDRKVGLKYSTYHCRVTGSGETTRIARWILTEDPLRKDGIGSAVEFAITLPVVGDVAASLSVTARVTRSGTLGSVERFRDLILRRHPEERTYPIVINIPSAPAPKGILDRFFRRN